MQEQKYSIKQWAKDDRPREKLLSKGSASLSDSELLAILISTGSREKSAIELAKDILKIGKDNLNELGKLTVKDLMSIKGIGEAKAITITAALELGRRRQASFNLTKPIIASSSEVANYLQNLLKDYPHEVFAVLFLNRANKINHFEIISQGGMTGTVADPRLILAGAIKVAACGMILVHNHPSGSLKPSGADIDLTKKIKTAGTYFDMKVFDHLIITSETYLSFADEGVL